VGSAPTGDAGHDLRDLFNAERSPRDVIHKGDRPGAVNQDVVHAVVDEILAYGVEPSSLERHQHFGTDSIGAQNQDWLSHGGRYSHHPAKGSHDPSRERRSGTRHQLTDPDLGSFRRVQVHPCCRILGSRPAGGLSHARASARVTWVRS
jgi:hypothetical protein